MATDIIIGIIIIVLFGFYLGLFTLGVEYYFGNKLKDISVINPIPRDGFELVLCFLGCISMVMLGFVLVRGFSFVSAYYPNFSIFVICFVLAVPLMFILSRVTWVKGYDPRNNKAENVDTAESA